MRRRHSDTRQGAALLVCDLTCDGSTILLGWRRPCRDQGHTQDGCSKQESIPVVAHVNAPLPQKEPMHVERRPARDPRRQAQKSGKAAYWTPNVLTTYW